MRFLPTLATLLSTVAAATATATVVSAIPRATFTQISDFGPNPSNASMYVYIPTTLAANPPIVVGVHWCHGNASDFYRYTTLASRADEQGFIVIYPSASTSDMCWDVSSTPTLTHLGGGDSLAIHSMVRYVQRLFPASDKKSVFSIGTSSGAMMTNVLLGAYPDVFAAGSAWAGVPFGCFAGPTTWSTECATGQLIHTSEEWGALVRKAYPGYEGRRRPRIQVVHGTLDDVLSFVNFGEEVKQWTNVHGVSATPDETEENVWGQSGFTRTRYGGGKVEAVVEEGKTHNLDVFTDEGLRFFGLVE